MDNNNPVAKEFEKLHEQWQEFVVSNRPIFHWKIPNDAQQLINGWVKLKESFDENNPDLLVHLPIPFSDESAYAWELADVFNHLVKEGLDETLPESGEDCQWQAPKSQQMQSGFEMLLASAQALLKEFGDCLDTLSLVIAPTSVKHEAPYRVWWEWAAAVHKDYEGWPEKLKLVVFDHAQKPFLAPVVESYSEQFFSAEASVDYTGALNKVLDQTDDGSDSAKVRQNLFHMQNAIAENNGPKLKESRKIALPLALDNQWFDIAANINLTCAAALMSWQHYDSALKEFRNAGLNAQAGKDQEIPGCDKLVLMALLNEATCLYLKGDLIPAAEQYEKTAVYAGEIYDDWSELEALRMGSFCREQAGQKREAWALATQAVELGREMELAKRQQTTLPFVGQAMLRMSPNPSVAKEVDQAMQDLIGQNWQENVKEALS